MFKVIKKVLLVLFLFSMGVIIVKKVIYDTTFGLVFDKNYYWEFEKSDVIKVEDERIIREKIKVNETRYFKKTINPDEASGVMANRQKMIGEWKKF